jgi:hypothetical protein
MRRDLVPVSLESPWQGPQKARPRCLWLIVGAIQTMRPWRFMGRDWFPDGPYSLSGRGSIPRRSTFTYDSKYLPLSQQEIPR